MRQLQIFVGDDEFQDIHRAARQEDLTTSEWVRDVLRRASRDRAGGDVAGKLAAVRAAAAHDYPTADIGWMNEEIERGYRAN